MLDNFIAWADAKVTELQAKGFEAVLTIATPTDNDSARIDIDSSRNIGRITFWSSGESYLEIIDIDLGETIYAKHLSFGVSSDFEKAFEEFFVGFQGA